MSVNPKMNTKKQFLFDAMSFVQFSCLPLNVKKIIADFCSLCVIFVFVLTRTLTYTHISDFIYIHIY